MFGKYTSTTIRSYCNGHPRMKIEYRDGKMYHFEEEDQAWAARDAKKEASIQKKVISGSGDKRGHGKTRP